MRILVVEDEDSIRNLIKMNLEMEGYEVVVLADGKKVVSTCKQQHFDLIILDVMLPGSGGFEICEQLRLFDRETPIFFVTARETSRDRIAGLKLGADDYLTKPFQLEELLLRVRNLLRRSAKDAALDHDIFHFGGNWVNFRTFEAMSNQGVIRLTNKEVKLLQLLTERKNDAISRQQILQAVWGYDVYPSTRTIDNFILSFRKYFEKDPSNPKYFLSIRGVGYKFSDRHLNDSNSNQ